jgi:hypothetical protein
MRGIVISLRAASALLAGLALLAEGTALGQAPLPIFDTHIHYSKAAWESFPPQAVLEMWRKAGIERAVVSSSPDDGTVMLYEAAPERVVPFLRPYRDDVNTGNWHQDPNLIAYLTGRLARGIYKGIGEFHAFDADIFARPQVRQMVALAAERGLYLYIHSGAEPVRRLLALDGRAKVFWAHAGMGEPPDVVGGLLDRYPALITETSFRASDIGAGGQLNPAWRTVLLKHKERILIGADTYITSRWADYGDIIGEHRRWLSQLPPDAAEAIAWRNAVRLFGSGGLKALEKK